MADDKTIIKSPLVKDLIDRGKLDGNPALPKYPSAQLYYKVMLESERQELKKQVEGVGYSWDDYEAGMKAHHPPIKREIPKVKNG